MDLCTKKRKARVLFRQKRKENISLVESSILMQVKKFITKLSNESESENLIGIYWPLKNEVDLRSLKEISGLSLALPASKQKGEITYHRWTDTTLKKDVYGILAPLEEPVLEPNQINLLIVPALAIDHNGIRLGYGGGCFDRLRSKGMWKEIEALVIVPSACISSSLLPKDKWDIPFDGWINEKEIFRLDK